MELCPRSYCLWFRKSLASSRPVEMSPDGRNREYLLAQVIRLVEKYIESDKLRIEPPLFDDVLLRRRIINHASYIERGGQAINFENTAALVQFSIRNDQSAQPATCWRGTRGKPVSM